MKNNYPVATNGPILNVFTKACYSMFERKEKQDNIYLSCYDPLKAAHPQKAQHN